MIIGEIETGGPIFITILVIVATILLFLLFREVVCWYYKINERLKKIDRICSDLDEIKTLLSENNESLKEFVEHFKNG